MKTYGFTSHQMSGLKKLSPVLTTLAILLIMSLATPCATEKPVHAQTVIDTIKVGEGGYSPVAIAVNPSTNRIYTANYNSTVSVIDGSSNGIVATINRGYDRIAVNPSTNRIYGVYNYMGGSFVCDVVDGSTNKYIGGVGLLSGWGSSGSVAVNPSTNRIYVTNTDFSTVWVIDGNTNAVTATVGVGTAGVNTRLRDVAVNPSTNRIYIAASTNDSGSTSNFVSDIDGLTNSVISTVNLPGSVVGHIAVNPNTNYIYVLTYIWNSISGTGSYVVSVIDGSSNGIVATVGVESSVDIAVNLSTNRIYVTSNTSSCIDGLCYVTGRIVSVIDGATNSVVTTVNIGGSDLLGFVGGVAVNPSTNRIYVANSGDNTVSVIDGATNTVIAMTVMGSGPSAVAVNHGTNRIYVANAVSKNLSVINGANNAIMATVDLGREPTAVAVNPSTNLIYVTSYYGKTVSVIDGLSNAVIATIATMNVDREPTAVAVNPSTNRIYVANSGGNTVSVIDGATNTVTATLNMGNTELGCIAVNPSTNRIYVVDKSYYSPNVAVIDGTTNTIVAKVGVGLDPLSVAVNPVTNRIYVACFNGGVVTVIDGTTNTVTANVSMAYGPRPLCGSWPVAVAVNPVTNRIYVVIGPSPYMGGCGDVRVNVIDGTTNTAVAWVGVGSDPHGVAVNPVTNRIYVTNHMSDTVSVIQDSHPPPAPVTDLLAGNATTSSVTLTWTASGDDGNIGTASQYDIRYSTDNITEANWASATQCTGMPSPQPAGSSENFTVTGLATNTTYYFAMKVADEVPNWSGLSNIATGTTSEQQYKLTTHVAYIDGGTHDVGEVIPSGGMYPTVTDIQLIAKRHDGYKFDHWIDNGTPVSNGSAEQPFTMNENKDITAVFRTDDGTGWRDQIKAGDILYNRGETTILSPFLPPIFANPLLAYLADDWSLLFDNRTKVYISHSALYIGNGKTIEATGVGVAEEDIQTWDYNHGAQNGRSNVYLYRPQCSDNIKTNAIAYAQNQIRKPYNPFYTVKKVKAANYPEPNANDLAKNYLKQCGFYCSELVWSAYYNAGINLEANDSHPTQPEGQPGDPITEGTGGEQWIYFSNPVLPRELTNNFGLYPDIPQNGETQQKEIQLNLVLIDQHIDKAEFLTCDAYIIVLCPVDLIVKDPDGLLINAISNQIPGAQYMISDFNGNGSLGDLIYIPNLKTGNYSISVIPEQGASPNDAYSLAFMVGGNVNSSIVLAQNTPINQIPTQGYTVEFNGNNLVRVEKIPAPPAPARVSPTLPNYLKPAQISLQYLSVNPQQASANQPVTVSTNVVNTGDQAGNLSVSLKIDGQVEQTRMVSVGPQGTQPVKFIVTKAQPGTYTVDIDGQKGSFTILGGSGSASGTSTVVGLIATLIVGLLIIIVVMLFRRRAY